MNHLGIEKAHIMGVSMGGMIAQELAINYPQRVMSMVDVPMQADREPARILRKWLR